MDDAQALALITSVSAILRRVEALESGQLGAKADVVVEIHRRIDRVEQIEKILSEDGVTADGFDKRIGQLEDQCEEDRTDFIGRLEELEKDKKLSDAVCRLCGLGLEERIKALERCEEIQNTEDVRRNDKLLALSERLSKLEGFSEPQRQDRWHATFNAALRTAAVDMYKHQDPDAYHHHLGECVEACHRDAVMHADRAHGPLADMSQGLFVPDDPTLDPALVTPPLTEKQWAALRPDPGWSQWDAKVEALVKAATRFLASHNAHNLRKNPDHDAGCGCCECEMVDSLKPFEASRGGE